MNRGVNLQSSPVQQMAAAGNPNWWNINSMRPPPSQPPSSSSSSSFHHPNFLQPLPPSFLIPPFAPNNDTSSHYHHHHPSWHVNHDNLHHQLPESWSQLLLGGLVGDQAFKKLENWEEQILLSSQAPNAPAVDVKQEIINSGISDGFMYGNNHHQDNFQSSLSHQIMQSTASASASSSPKSSCVSSFSANSMLDFSSKTDARHPPPHRSSEQSCNSTANGGAVKRARVQPSSTPTTFKVRKEKLGDRITALHQIVSPFGKTDTASVLLEAIGYIRFLQSQIEALSLPYLGSGSSNMRHQQQQQQPPQSAVHGERNCMFPEDPGQLLNDNCIKRKGAPEQDAIPLEEAKKDLRSRGLCLVPVSCTHQVGSDNGADYWAPTLGGGGFGQ